jgi:hypothetical protein
MQPDQDRGYCEACGGNTVTSARLREGRGTCVGCSVRELHTGQRPPTRAPGASEVRRHDNTGENSRPINVTDSAPGHSRCPRASGCLRNWEEALGFARNLMRAARRALQANVKLHDLKLVLDERAARVAVLSTPLDVGTLNAVPPVTHCEDWYALLVFNIDFLASESISGVV